MPLARSSKQPYSEPGYWSLFVAPEGGIGKVYQVKGDAELMRYTHAEGVNIQASCNFKTAYTLANLTQDQAGWVEFYANSETPPSAPDRASVTENCQGWTVRVLERLVEKDIVTEAWLAYIRGIVEPLE